VLLFLAIGFADLGGCGADVSTARRVIVPGTTARFIDPFRINAQSRSKELTRRFGTGRKIERAKTLRHQRKNENLEMPYEDGNLLTSDPIAELDAAQPRRWSGPRLRRIHRGTGPGLDEASSRKCFGH
jgi:hypothetical protein